MTAIIQGVHKPMTDEPHFTAPAASDRDATTPPGDMGDMGDMGADDTHDRWRNVYLTKPGLLGQYTTRGWYDGSTVYVCGQPAAHVRAGYWRLDGRIAMGRGQGYLCCACWVYEAGLYGRDERGR